MSIDKEAAAVLDRAAEILAAPERWTKHASARTAEGEELYRWDPPEAVCFCLGTAVDKAAHELFGEPVLGGGDISHRADRFLAGLPADAIDDDCTAAVVHFNDDRKTTHHMVLDRLAEAARAARGGR